MCVHYVVVCTSAGVAADTLTGLTVEEAVSLLLYLTNITANLYFYLCCREHLTCAWVSVSPKR